MSDTLFAVPSTLEGLASIFDFGDAMRAYNVSPTPDEADFMGSLMDWYAVGLDLRNGIESELAKSAQQLKLAI